ncbi:MAG TPA: D-alanyl-D-alanine carboxypeptidase [Kofleriaceae bacterium]|nr:D-alanyl-D-alanine carboxypeptidase [Kofleriaceae bacterium]
MIATRTVPRSAFFGVTLVVVASMATAAPARAGHGPATGKRKAKAAPTTRARSAAPPLRTRTRALTLDGSLGGGHRAEPMLDELRAELDAIWRGRTLRRGITAVYVVWADTGEAVYAEHADEPLNPASNTKLVATASALATLGPHWRYVTRLLGPQPGGDGTIAGDVYLLGTADPTLAPAHIDRMAENLAASGVRRIAGDIVVGLRPLRDSVGLAPVDLQILGDTIGAPPQITILPPLSGVVTVDNQAETVERGASRIAVHRGLSPASGDTLPQVVLTVTGRIRAGHTLKLRRWLSHRDVIAARFLAAAVAAHGITVDGTVRREAWSGYVTRSAAAGFLPTELARHESAELSRIVARINKPSNNFLADRIIMTAGGVAADTTPNMDAGVALMGSWLERAGIDPDAVVLDTGSGLSYATEISVRNIVRVLRTAAGYETPEDLPRPALVMADSFRHSLAVAGIDGTLRHRFVRSDVKGQMIGKTGTLTGIIALSGFVSAKDGRTLCFSIVTNGGRHRRRNFIRRAQADMVKAMHHYLDARKSRLAAAPASAAN